jgi:uncharacterized protein
MTAATIPTGSPSGRRACNDNLVMRAAEGLPRSAGLGLRPEHAAAWLAGASEVGFAEVHAENYMMAGGPALALLDAVAELYPISLHGVALSLGGAEPLDHEHLQRLKTLVSRVQPASFSEHLAWSSHDGVYYNDLFPIAYDLETLLRVVAHVDQTQAELGMRLLLENPSTYVAFSHSDWDEVDFLTEIARRTGCGLLLDVNNVAVSAHNHGYSAEEYIARFPHHLTGEIHIAGHDAQQDANGDTVLIDGHGSPVAESVWNLLEQALQLGGRRPVLLERDNKVPAFDKLVPELHWIADALASADAPSEALTC